jgi:hypothetical protein
VTEKREGFVMMKKGEWRRGLPRARCLYHLFDSSNDFHYERRLEIYATLPDELSSSEYIVWVGRK